MLCRSVEVVTKTTTAERESADSSHRSMYQHFQLQSSEVTGETATEVVTSQGGEGIEAVQTTTFVDNEVGMVRDEPTSQNVVAKVDGTTDVSLGEFLSRPTMIQTYSWLSSTPDGQFVNFFPWQNFLNNAVIKKKIDNYAFLRGNLHLKYLVNGTPFQYGVMRAAYQPLWGLNADKIRASTALLDPLVPASQLPGVYLYPQANAGGEQTLPFLYHKNWLDITSNADVLDMGRVSLYQYAPLRLAVTGGTTSVTIRVYAWMTNVELMGPTTKLTLQAKDEYGDGSVSKPASAVAAVAATLSNIPYIGPFARATSIGATAVASIARLFGYTNVPVVEDVHAFIPMNGPMLASSHIGTAVQKLSLDPKQELSIDPAPHGIGSYDELVLANLKQKESFLALAEWAPGDAEGAQLYAQRITPQLFRSTTVLNGLSAPVGQRQYHIPLSYLGNMFHNWRGDIIVRVKVVCTKFHKGRLKIQYDPVQSLTATNAPENAVYSNILDIGEEDDMEIRIPYHQDWAWLSTNHTNDVNWTTTGALSPRRGIDNGTICIRVANVLSAPSSTASVRLLFYVRGAENFEFANPMDVIGGGLSPQMFSLQASDETSVVSQQVSFGPPTTVSDDRYGLNFGEAVLSLRDLLHRHVITDSVAVVQFDSDINQIKKIYRRMPMASGFYTNTTYNNAVLGTRIVGVGTLPFYYPEMHPLPYVTGMFAGYRGSVNYVVTPSDVNFIDDIRVSRSITNIGENVADTYYSAANTTVGLSFSGYAAFANRPYARQGLSGLAITSNRTNASLCFNFPDYNGFNFSLVEPSLYGVGNPEDGTREQGVRLMVQTKNNSTVDGYGLTITTAAGAGPDFTCLYFVCCPTLDVPDAAIVPP